MSKQLDPSNTGLGDISDLMSNRGLSDLSWLNVDEEEYKKYEVLPKQNIDIIPEVQKWLMESKEGVPELIPMKPFVMVNSNHLEHKTCASSGNFDNIINKTARLMIAGKTTKEIVSELKLEFAPHELKLATDGIKEVLSERGLMGNVYIDSKHFPKISTNKSDKDFIKKYAKKAKFVIGSCNGCNGCNCHKTNVCDTFGGKISVDQVNYDQRLVASYAASLLEEKRPIDTSRIASSGTSWKNVLKEAFLKPVLSNSPEVANTAWTQKPVQKVAVTESDIKNFIDRKTQPSGIDKLPGGVYLKFARSIMASSDPQSLVAGSADAEVSSLYEDIGLLGHTYIDVDALGGCKNTVAFVVKYNKKPDFFLRRSASCSHCGGEQDGHCHQLSQIGNVVTSKPSYDKQTFALALKRAASEKRITIAQMQSILTKTNDKSDFRKLTAQINLFKPKEVKTEKAYTHSKVVASFNGRAEEVAIDAKEAMRKISHLMNTGLSGSKLKEAILSIYNRKDLAQIKDVGRVAAKNNGIQGHFFIDPTAYKDYGRGCEEGSKQFRKRGAGNLMVASSCVGCTSQTVSGWCSKYSKNIINKIPKEVTASIKDAKPVNTTSIEIDPSLKYGLDSSMDDIELSPKKVIPLNISLTSRDID